MVHLDTSSPPKDIGLPGLNLQFCSESLARFAQSLLVLEPQSLRRHYLDYKPGHHCTSLYQVFNGNQHSLFYVKSIANPVLFAQIAEQLKRGGDSISKFCVVDTQYRSILCRYPCDLNLPSVAILTHHKLRARIFAQSVQFDSIVPQGKLSPLQYKPEKRFIARLTDGNDNAVACKLYTQQRFRALNLAFLRQHSSPFVDVVAVNPHQNMVLYKWLSGESLTEQLTKEHASQYVYESGRQLAQFHQLTPPNQARAINDNKLIRLIYQHASNAIKLLPDQSRLIALLANKIALSLRNLPNHFGFIHGDFYTDQVLVTEGGLRFLDFDNLCIWYRGYDLANFIAHLFYRATLGFISPRQQHDAEQSFLAGYRSLVKICVRETNVLTALCLFQLIYHPLRFGSPRWQHDISSLLKACYLKLYEN